MKVPMKDTARTFEQDGLQITATFVENSANLTWKGVSDMPNPEELLTPFLQQLLPELAGKRVTVDLRALSYMNSASQAPVLRFLRSLGQRQVVTTTLFNAQLDWQGLLYRCASALFRGNPTLMGERL